MSDFKFACPACGQRMGANDDYVGQQINCPACHALIVVPPNPAAPPAPVQSSIAIATPPDRPPPPAPPPVVRLSVSALSAPQHQAPAATASQDLQSLRAYQAHAHKTKKSYSGLTTAVVAVLLIGASAFLNRDWLTAKWHSIHGPSAAQIAATNQPPPPPPPPELTAPEIMQKVAEVYKALPSFTSTGKIISVKDMSAINPAFAAAGPVTVAADLTLKMSKPLSFRIDSSITVGTSNITTTGWYTGNGDFLQLNNRRNKMPSHGDLFSAFNNGVNVGVGDIVDLFINDTSDGLVAPGIEWSRNQDDKINGQPCYVLSGTVKFNNVLVWVNRASFLIPQTLVLMDGKSGLATMDDSKIKEALKAMNNGKEPTLAQIAAVKKAAKIMGTIIDTYDNIQTNTPIAAADFQPDAPAAAMTGANQPGGGGGVGAPAGGGGGGRATRIANGANRRGN
jgi:DNA-directed RNA polymerase subunit RPC12/RpoP